MSYWFLSDSWMHSILYGHREVVDSLKTCLVGIFYAHVFLIGLGIDPNQSICGSIFVLDITHNALIVLATFVYVAAYEHGCLLADFSHLL